MARLRANIGLGWPAAWEARIAVRFQSVTTSARAASGAKSMLHTRNKHTATVFAGLSACMVFPPGRQGCEGSRRWVRALRNIRRFGARLRVGTLGEVTPQRRTIHTTISYIRQSTFVKSRKFAQRGFEARGSP